MTPRLQITLFGEFNLIYADGPAPTFSGDRPVSLLAYLLLHRHTAVSRQHLAFTFWPDSSDSQARTNLRNLFHTLRRTLPAANSFILADSMTLQWQSDADVWLDVAEFEAALAAAKTAVSATNKIAHLETAISLYKGDLLPANYDDWIIPRREELRQAYLDALHQLVSLLEQAGDYRAAVRAGQRLIQKDPLDESACIHLMRLHALNGDRAGIRRIYETCVAALRRDLDVEPAPTTQAAFEKLLRLNTPAAPVPPAIGPVRPLPLPVPATAFIGREAELAQIAELLADPACRLLTIAGPGGIGKTRLALQTAVGHRPVFADGAAWVALNTVQTPEHLAAAVAEALNYRLRGAGNTESELLHLVSTKELLIVLDNFEHLLPAADFVTRMLNETTAVKLVVTSRQALELPAEWRFDLGALPIPDEQTTETLADNSAVQLFIQSARRAAGGFSPAPADYPAISRICRLVGGMPLGLELAASWLRLLSCAEIADEIEQSLDFLTVTHRHIPPRHRSLRAVFEYSWDLLRPDEQQMLLRLSIFNGGFTREAAAAVALADLPQLSALVERSLVHRISPGRYTLHNVIRQYAADRLQTNPAAHSETAQRHSTYYLEWLADQDSRLRGAAQKEALAAIAAEMANVRLAWQWATGQRCYGVLRCAAFPLFYFYEVRGLLAEGETTFRLAAESLKLGEETAANRESRLAVTAMQIYQAYLSFRQGKVAIADPLLRQTVADLQNLSADSLLTHGLIYLGILEWSLGHFVEAVDCLQNALAAATELLYKWEMAMAQVYLGLVRYDRGQLAEARQQLTAVQPLAQNLGDPRLLANFLLIFGRTNLLLGHLGEAEQQLSACLAMTQETRDPNSITYATLYLGVVKQAQGDLAAARQLIEQSVTLYTGSNDWVGLERAWVTMGFLEIAAQNFKAATAHFLAFLRSQQRVHSLRFILAAVVGMAVCRAYAGDACTALVWTSSVLRHQGLDWEVRQRAETFTAELESQLTAGQIAAARQQAANQPFEAILAAVIEP